MILGFRIQKQQNFHFRVYDQNFDKICKKSFNLIENRSILLFLKIRFADIRIHRVPRRASYNDSGSFVGSGSSRTLAQLLPVAQEPSQSRSPRSDHSGRGSMSGKSSDGSKKYVSGDYEDDHRPSQTLSDRPSGERRRRRRRKKHKESSRSKELREDYESLSPHPYSDTTGAAYTDKSNAPYYDKSSDPYVPESETTGPQSIALGKPALESTGSVSADPELEKTEYKKRRRRKKHKDDKSDDHDRLDSRSPRSASNEPTIKRSTSRRRRSSGSVHSDANTLDVDFGNSAIVSEGGAGKRRGSRDLEKITIPTGSPDANKVSKTKLPMLRNMTDELVETSGVSPESHTSRSTRANTRGQESSRSTMLVEERRRDGRKRDVSGWRKGIDSVRRRSWQSKLGLQCLGLRLKF